MGKQDEDTSRELAFLPINQRNSPPAAKHRRAYLSCQRCRRRKCRCEPHNGQSRPCRRCASDNQPCEFRNTRSEKRKASSHVDSVEPGTRPYRSFDEDQTDSWPPPSPPRLNSTSLPPETSPVQTPTAEISQPWSVRNSDVPAALDARTRIVSAHLHNTSDALDLLTFAATGSQSQHIPPAASVGGSALLNSQARPDLISTGNNALGDIDESAAWVGFVLIRKGVVTQHEIIEYLDFFFERLWPLKPVVPSYYRDKRRYPLLVVEEPLLVICLVTLSSRYHPLSGSHGEIRSERIHWQAWKFLQKFLQSVMWGSTTTRSLGSIASMLLLIDWHVKSINNTMDFTEGDGDSIGLAEDPMSNLRGSSKDASSLTGQGRYGMTSLMEKLNIVSPAYRSNKMSWILLSNAIALAHEGCCFEHDAQNSASNLPEAESIKKEWSRLVCVFIYLSDEGLATRLGLEPLLPEKSRQVVKDRFSTTFADSLSDSLLWEGYFELFVEARKGREFLHSLRKAETSLSNLNMVPELEHLSRALNRWKRQYHHRHNANAFLSACLDMEFYYIVMYSFAPATQALQSSPEVASSQNAEALSGFAVQAAQASHDLLTIVVDILQPAALMAYLPVRCWLFIVSASLHLLKATLAKDQLVSESDPSIHLLRCTIRAVHDGSPDDSHMARRFSKFLGIVLQAALQNSTGTASSEANSTLDREIGAFQMGNNDDNDDFASILEDVGTWEIPLSIDIVSDPLTWWDTSLGRYGFSRFP